MIYFHLFPWGWGTSAICLFPCFSFFLMQTHIGMQTVDQSSLTCCTFGLEFLQVAIIYLLIYFCRRVQPTIEFIFSVTEEAIYAHAIITAKLVSSFTLLFVLRCYFSYCNVLSDAILLPLISWLEKKHLN